MAEKDPAQIILSEKEFAALEAACEAPPRVSPGLTEAIRNSRLTFVDDPRAAKSDGVIDGA